MKKFLKMLSMMLAVIFITVAFAPAAFAVTYAPLSWLSWPQQKRYDYDTRYTYAIQRFLADRYNRPEDLAVDGIFGEKTDFYVRRFQNDAGLPIDGIVGRKTWEKMYHKDYMYKKVQYVGNEEIMGMGTDAAPLAMYYMEYLTVKDTNGSTDGNTTAFEYNGRVERWYVSDYSTFLAIYK